MLQRIREGLGKWVFGALLALIALSFVFFGIDFNIGVPTFAAKVNGEEVDLFEFQRQLQVAQNQYQQIIPELSEELSQQIRDDVLQAMVRREALQQQVSDAGYRISDARLTEAVRARPEFHIDGEFSMDVYQGRLRSLGFTPQMFERSQRRDLEINELQQGIADSTLFTPTEFRQYIQLVSERREVGFAVFPAANFIDGAQVAEGAVEEFYASHQAEYMTDEMVDIEYIRLTRDGIASGLEVSEEQLRGFYDAQAEDYATSEQRQARHILLTGTDAEPRAQAVLLRLQAGEDFAAVASEVSEDGGTKTSGGDLGWVGRGALVGPFEDALFSLSEGELAGPVETEFGFHIIRLESVQAPEVPPYDTVRANLRGDYLSSQAEDLFYERGTELDERSFDALTELASVAKAAELPLQRLLGLTRRGDTPVFPISQPIVDAAFSEAVLKEGENSKLIQLSDVDVVVLRVVQHRLPEPRSLDELRDEISARLRQEQAEAAAAAQGALFLAALEGGADASAADEQQGEWHEPRWIARGSTDEATPTELVAKVFEASWDAGAGSQHYGLRLGNGDYAVAEMTRREPGQPQSISREERDNRKRQLGSQAAVFEFSAYLAEVTERSRVQIPERVAQGDF
jgi:peptidyl-prolyl cis-trans isomerase D